MTKIGFIGVGNMGGPMARNLVQAGHELAAFDLDEEKLNLVVQAGARRAASVADAVAGAEMLVTMLPAGEHVRAVYTGEDGVIAASAAGTLLIDSSTIDVDSARAAHAAAAAAGFEMIDAPVSGGVGGAEAGTLTFMCGGTAAAFARAKPILDVMGGNIFHAGDAGAGQVAKICNNMILGAAMIVTGEAFTLGQRPRPRCAIAVRYRQDRLGPDLGADQLLPCAGTGADLARQPRLSAGLPPSR